MSRTKVVGLLAFTLLISGCGRTPAESSPGLLPAPTDLKYTCGSHAFSPDLLSQPAVAEQASDPPAVALREFLARWGMDIDTLPDAGWLLAGQDGRTAEFIAQVDGELPFVLVSLENRDTGWQVAYWQDCRPEAVLDGLGIATWKFDRDLPLPRSTDRQFWALVIERTCASGRSSEGRMAAPMILPGQDEILVVFGVRPLEGIQTCQSSPRARVLVSLDQPIGDRRLLDGSFLPPLDPAAPEPWEVPGS